MFGLAWVCFTYAIFSIGFKSLYPDPDTINSIFRISSLIILHINFLLICWIIIKVQHQLIAYFIIGNLFFFVGSVLSVYVSLTGIHNNPNSIFYFGNSLNTIFQTVLLSEVFCFFFDFYTH